MDPSVAIRPAFLAGELKPFTLSHSTALSKSPFVSFRAFLQSIMPALVFSLNSLTSDAAMLTFPPHYFFQEWSRPLGSHQRELGPQARLEFQHHPRFPRPPIFYV